ncbi:carbamoyltransferase C-terminal domain-containing protein [Peterkaempfera bronchialis]|uniref:carbamoyltransferase C-terminal domain-containing protein n=1 Tax=Peterkaempfera bronchialis TaxID=2126346 RepID=UPI001E3B8DBB|nr:carbamoyltransferase C-terminal domain-containing protein [Peterkaempfera bronchialis]
MDAVWAASMRPNPAAGWWLAEEREELAALLPAPLGERLRLLSHHTAHVLSGYLLSGHERAGGLVIDAGGSSLGADFGPGRERITGYDLWPDRIDRLYQGMPAVVPGPVGPRRVHSSPGHFYRNLARRVIPPGDEPEGSMMALAAFGDLHLNGRLAADSGFDTLFVAPAPHDAGTAVGAALYGWHYQLGQERVPVPTDAAWGPGPGVLPTTTVPSGYRALSQLGSGLAPTVAALLAEHRIVGWVQGQLEFGPRALGHRSILAHPGHTATRDRLNAIKKRAAYRPFAPAVLTEHATEWFMSSGDPFMNRVATVRRCRADRIAAVTHHDGTARVQSVAADHQGLRDLLEQFRDLTGLPLLLNTSLNRKGAPILRTAEQAVAAAVDLRLDALAVGDTLLLADHVPGPRAASLRAR